MTQCNSITFLINIEHPRFFVKKKKCRKSLAISHFYLALCRFLFSLVKLYHLQKESIEAKDMMLFFSNEYIPCNYFPNNFYSIHCFSIAFQVLLLLMLKTRAISQSDFEEFDFTTNDEG